MERKFLKLTTLLFCLTLSFSLYAQDKKEIPAGYAGEWAFTVSDAPYGYEKGTATLLVEEGTLKGEFKLGGSTMKVNSFTAKDAGYMCTVYIDGYPVDVILSLKEGKLVGKANDGQSDYGITFSKK